MQEFQHLPSLGFQDHFMLSKVQCYLLNTEIVKNQGSLKNTTREFHERAFQTSKDAKQI